MTNWHPIPNFIRETKDGVILSDLFIDNITLLESFNPQHDKVRNLSSIIDELNENINSIGESFYDNSLGSVEEQTIRMEKTITEYNIEKNIEEKLISDIKDLLQQLSSGEKWYAIHKYLNVVNVNWIY